MQWLQTLDVALFHRVNPALSNSFLDVFMPFCSGNRWFAPVLVVVCLSLIVWGGVRGRLCVLMVLLAVALGDTLVINTIKQLVGRPRPFHVLLDAHVPASIGRTDSGSMPSSHAANWFAATLVMFVYYRRSLWFMLPTALLVGFSRIYNGVHYPSDVLAGAILGAGYAAWGVWTLNALWQRAGRRWFPLWWERLPSLMNPVLQPMPAARRDPARTLELAAMQDAQWLHLGFALILLQLIGNLLFLAGGKSELTEGEAWLWMWSKHFVTPLNAGPPLIARLTWLCAWLWGDTVFGVRFFAPIVSAVIGLCWLRFLARTANARAAFWFCLLLMAVPLLAVGSTLMTTDLLSVLFWTFAVIAGWRAMQENSPIREWIFAGVWLGLGIVNSNAAALQLLCWAVFLFLCVPARKHLHRPGPWLALLAGVVCASPIVIRGLQHGWVNSQPGVADGGLPGSWTFNAANVWHGLAHHMPEDLGVTVLVLNLFLVPPAIWAIIAFWPHRREHTLLLYLFSMGAPWFGCFFLLSLRSRMQPHWIAPAAPPLLCLAAVYWEKRWRLGLRAIKWWLTSGSVAGFLALALTLDPDLITKISKRPPPARWDPLRDARAWKETAGAVAGAREKLQTEGTPVFIIGENPGIVSEVTFNLPEAGMSAPDQPLVYLRTFGGAMKRADDWRGYQERKGQNAIYVRELKLNGAGTPEPPEELKEEFDSLVDIGETIIRHRDRPFRRIQMIECRNLR